MARALTAASAVQAAAIRRTSGFTPQDVVTGARCSSGWQWFSSARASKEVTFPGGEPLLQAKGLTVVASGAQALGLSVMVFSGYTLAEVHELASTGAEELLASIDVLVDGSYDATQPEALRNRVGSRNRHFHYLRASLQCAGRDHWRSPAHTGVARDGQWRSNGQWLAGACQLLRP